MAPDALKTQSARARILDYFKQNVGKVVNKEELIEVANISDWARRVRELRDEFGYRISSFADRADLRPGQYVLEAPDPDPKARRRHIKSDTRARILSRDGFTCQVCGLGAGDPDPDHPHRKIRLHVDHITPISVGGDDSDDNLRTICNICNQNRSNLFQRDDLTIDALVFIRKQPRKVQKQVYEFLKNKFDRQ